MLGPRCDGDDWPEDLCDCPDPAPNRVRDAAKVLAALAPVLVAALKHGPVVWKFFADRLREPARPRPPRRRARAPRKPRP